MFSQLSIIIPYRECSAERARNYEWTRGYLSAAFPGAEIIVADDGQAGEHFSAALSRNAGAARATREVLLFSDADLFYPVSAISEGLAAIRAGAAWVAPFHGYRMLSPAATATLLRRTPEPGFEPPDEWITERTDDFSVGGVTLIPRATFEMIGGYDRRIVAWGREDWIFRIVADALAGPMVRTGTNIYHLWHENARARAARAGLFATASHLWKRYEDARGDAAAVRAIVDEQAVGPAFSVLIPYEAGCAARDGFIGWIERYYRHHLPEAEIILAGDGHAEGDSPNRSRMRNACARQARSDIYVFLDADCLVRPSEVRAAVAQVRAGSALTMWRGVDYLTQEETARITGLDARETPTIRRKGVGQHLDICKGFNFVLSRQTFETVNGFDEGFVGYAYEDMAFTEAVETLVGPCERIPYDAAHLWHPDDPCRVTERANGQLEANRARLGRYEAARGHAAAMRALTRGELSPSGREGGMTVQTGVTFSLLIPFHSDGGARARIYRWLRDYYTRELPEAEILTGDDDSGGALLNRSRMRNNAAKAAGTDLFVFVDADAYIAPADIRSLVEQARGGALAQPLCTFYLNQEATERALSGRDWSAPEQTAIYKRHQPVAGHVFACPRWIYNAAGGFDERYHGWGGEDPAFTLAVKSLVGDPVRLDCSSYHLEHPRSAEMRITAETHRGNALLFDGMARAASSREEARLYLQPHFAGRGVLRVLGVCQRYPPSMCAGVELSMHACMKALQRRGHDCAVVTEDSGRGLYDGLPLLPWDSLQESAGEYDILIGSHTGVLPAAGAANLAERPCIAMMHNDHNTREVAQARKLGARVWGNSRWVSDALGCDGYLWPQVDAGAYRVEGIGDCIGIVGLSANKARIFWEIAARLPKRAFLAVRNAYDEQIIPDVIPANVTVLETLEDMRLFYSRIRLLLMPSGYESFGRTALEACCSGIPVLAHATPGLVESMGESMHAFMLHTLDPGNWVTMIRGFDRKAAYQQASEVARARYASYLEESRGQSDRFEAELRRLAQRAPRRVAEATFRSLRTPDLYIRPLRAHFKDWLFRTRDAHIIAALRSGQYVVEEVR